MAKTIKKNPSTRLNRGVEAGPAPAADPGDARAMAMALRPSLNAAVVVSTYGKPIGLGDDDVVALMDRLAEEVKDVWAGDMKRAEAMLFAQAHALQAIFMNLARRANGAELIKHWDAYLRMALKAQNQCRMTLETLATIKNPPVVIARQANINNGGQQQVNNVAAAASGPSRADAANAATARTELLEANDGERLDTGATRAAGSADPHVVPLEAVDRSANR